MSDDAGIYEAELDQMQTEANPTAEDRIRQLTQSIGRHEQDDSFTLGVRGMKRKPAMSLPEVVPMSLAVSLRDVSRCLWPFPSVGKSGGCPF
jgi:hypothetical protein